MDVLIVNVADGTEERRPRTADEESQAAQDAAGAEARRQVDAATPSTQAQIAALKAQNLALINTTGALLDIVMGM